MKRPLLKLDILRYRERTHDFSAAEHGAYLLLLLHYWQFGSLPTADDKLARIADVTPFDWIDMRPRLARLFEAGWRDRRIERERARAFERSATATRSANLSWVFRRRRQANAKATANASAKASHSANEAESDVVTIPTFEQFWSVYDAFGPRSGSRDHAWEAFDLLSDADKAAAMDALSVAKVLGLSADRYLRERAFAAVLS